MLYMEPLVVNRSVAQRLDEPRKLTYRYATAVMKGGLSDPRCFTLPRSVPTRHKQSLAI